MSMLAVLTPGTPATEALGRVLDAKAIPAQLQGVDSSSAAAILEKDHQRLAARTGCRLVVDPRIGLVGLLVLGPTDEGGH